MSRLRILLVVLVMTAACVTGAKAGVRIRFVIDPEHLAHCESGRASLALWNDGPDSLRVNVYVSAAFETVYAGPRLLRARLGPRQIIRRALEFPVPPGLPAGRYSVSMMAVASDSSRDATADSLDVLDSGCPGGQLPALPANLVLDLVADGVGLDIPTATIEGSWGALKARYDSKPRRE